MKIYRGEAIIADVIITDQSYRDFSIMGDDIVILDFYLQTQIEFIKNDYCIVFGERYSMIEKPVPEMIKGVFHYNIKFYNTYKELEKVKVFLYDTDRDLSQSDFSFTCSPSEIVRLIVDNMNAVQGNIWTVGNVIQGEVKTITISNQSCLELLSSAASEWDTEWYVEGHVINLAKRTVQDNPMKTLSIGTGLLSVQQEALGNTSVTRLYALGGTKNLPTSYGSTRLKMDVPFLEMTGADIFEDIVIFDDIYPHRLGTVSSVRQTSQGIFYFTDAGLNFNPNDYQIDGLTKHIIFQSGALVGYDFEVNYNVATGEFEIIRYREASGEMLPSQALAPSVGDTYIIYNIAMPQSYITAAENELKAKAQAYFDKIKNDKLSFNITLDEVYFTKNGLTLQPGEEVVLMHNYIDVLKNGMNIRITSFRRYINQPHRFDGVKVSDIVYSNPISQINRKIDEVENVIERTGISNPNYPRRNWHDLSETMNMLQKAFLNFSEGINPITIKTMQLIVGDESLQFRFVNNKTNPVQIDHAFIFEKQTGKFTTASGIIQHMTLDITDIKNSHAPDEYKYWDIAAYTSQILEPDKAYYLYLKCDKNGTTGIFVLSETAIEMEEVSGYYHFLVGILNSQQDNDRSFAQLYGFTEVLPGRITTDRIVSGNGQSFFDMLANAMKLGDALDFNTHGDGKLRLKGTIAQSLAGDEFPIGVFRGEFNSSYVYYKGDQVTYNGSTWIYIYETPASGKYPAIESSYWGLVAAKGEQGIPGADGLDGAAGEDAKYVVLTASQLAVAFNTAGNDPNPYSVSLIAIAYNVTTPYFEFFFNDLSMGQPSTNNLKDFHTAGMTFNDFPIKIEVQVMEGSSSGPIVARDQISIIGMKAGDNAVQAVIDNAAHTVPADEYGNVTEYSGSGCTIQVFEGANLLTFYTSPNYVAGSWCISGIEVTPSGSLSVGTRYGNETTSCVIHNHNWMDQSVNVATVKFSITAIKKDGTYVYLDIIQTITKSKKGTKGDQGLPGNDGSDGNFIEYRYAKNGSTSTPPSITVTDLNPSGWSTTPPSVGYLEYLWMTKAKKNYSGTYLIENWSTPVRIKGDQGDKGDTGDLGASPVYRGVYDSSKTYYGTSKRVDIVKYNSTYYVARTDVGTFSNKIPTNTSYWNEFGAQFESIATNLLLAEGANIADWIMVNGKITSQNETTDGTPRAQMDGVNGNINFASDINIYTETAGSESKKQTIKIDSTNGILESRLSNGDVSYFSSQGFFSNKAGIDCLPTTTGVYLKASVTALGFGKMSKDYWGSNWGIAGVFGTASNSSSSPAPAYGGYFTDLFASGFILKKKSIEDSDSWVNLGRGDTFVISITTTGTKNIYLPPVPYIGEIHYIKQLYQGGLRLYPYTGQKLYDDSSENTYYPISEGETVIAIYYEFYLNSVLQKAWILNKIKY